MKSLNSTMSKFDRYLSETVFSSKNELTQKQTREILLRALKDFFEGKLALEELASIATDIYYTLNSPFRITTEWEHSLGNILENLTEVDYYKEEGRKDKYARDMHETVMKELEEYYEKNKWRIEKKE
ncbi:MAG: hypothetical protein HYU80_02485 [Candidatus Blackburnbacteria bacterium]|nr:hypothetical protein [Candidatus Blackburnbacteria bacterium]